ncbi:Hypothetical protein PENO1_111080 [Penicillium occitanis (nom. inval.)]|nr:Hypothetical protein PENO1_111080 [Penicillium occitanis (nom. inval.)]PCG88355.1 hypothetical protein PENOC_111340 [Penicillium occitanis (nom. inval.)]
MVIPSVATGTGLSNDSATQWRSHNAQRWQADLRRAVPPTTQSAGSSTPGDAHEELSMDCEIVVKIRDDASKKMLRSVKPAEIVQRAERARKDAAKKGTSLALAGHFFVAARPLPPGDISLRAYHAAAAEALLKHGDKWVKLFGANAYVRILTWRVVADGIPVHTVDLQSGIEDFKQQLIAWNDDNWSQGLKVEIAYVGWLAKPRKHEASLVIEFTNPIVANNAIARDTIWQSRIHTNRPYNKEGSAPSQNTPAGPVRKSTRPGSALQRMVGKSSPSVLTAKVRTKPQAAACIDTHRVPSHLQEQARIALENYNPTPQEAAKAPKKHGKAAAKAPAKSTTKRTKTATQDNAESTQPATQATEIVTESVAQSNNQPAEQHVTQNVEQPVDQPATQAVDHTVAQPVAQSVTQPAAQCADPLVTQSNPATRPSTQIAHDTPTPMAPTVVRTKDFQPIQPANQEKRGRGRSPKSKASSNDEQQEQVPLSSVEAAIASAEAMMKQARMEADSYESLVSTVANNPPPDGGWETVTRPYRRRTPPVAQGRTATLTKRLTPVRKFRKPVQGPPRSPNYIMTRKRAREQSQASDGAPLPPPSTITSRVEGGKTILSSSADFRKLDSTALSSEINELMDRFTGSTQRAWEREEQRALLIFEDRDTISRYINTQFTG